MTQRLANAAEILQIKLVDHIIVGLPARYSFREGGLL
jgi:DNA repair protein RadC